MSATADRRAIPETPDGTYAGPHPMFDEHFSEPEDEHFSEPEGEQN
jgi:hypothetical protein